MARLLGAGFAESGGGSWRREDKRYGQDVLMPKGATSVAGPGRSLLSNWWSTRICLGNGRAYQKSGEVDDPNGDPK